MLKLFKEEVEHMTIKLIMEFSEAKNENMART